MHPIPSARPSAVDLCASAAEDHRSLRRSANQPLNPPVTATAFFDAHHLSYQPFQNVLSNVCVGTCAVILWRYIVTLEFDLVVKQVLVLSVFKFNQQKSAAKIFGHGNECAFSRQKHTCFWGPNRFGYI